ncbi:DUF4147 domain-containing protein [Algirhabdus cladophorae]|uniref:DUF4147 domain-containing protein n=1 Tax=Algirhabdus cladophorae TaxID=3377108 RepID=UPI003B845DAF
MIQADCRTTLFHLFRSGVAAVKGDRAVRAWLANNRIDQPTHIFAAGKAAVAMFEGLPPAWRSFTPSLLVTKTEHTGAADLGRNVQAFEAGHPIPDKASLIAGERAVSFVNSAAADSRMLVLLSGGASSLVEHLKPEVRFSQLIALTKKALGEGADIAEVNTRRKTMSEIKGGGLLGNFTGKSVQVLAISDVCGDGIDVIGSGLAAAPSTANFQYRSHVIASNALARDAVVRDAAGRGLPIVVNQETMYADVADVASHIAKDVMDGPRGLYVYGGEPTVILPKKPGKGGRNQALALELARRFRNRLDISGLVAGTDGTDGPTDAAGGYLDGNTFECQPGAAEALSTANSAQFLARTGHQIITGPTGTNVMDLALMIKHS